MTTVLAFLVTLGVLIAVHEWGHFQVARWCGVRVLRFSIGFGRVVWRRQRDAASTEYTLSLLPLGGYVRMLDSREGPVPEAWRAQAFDQQPLRSRVAIVAAGPLANLLLAALLFTATHWIGVREPAAHLATPPVGGLAAQAGLLPGDRVDAVIDDDERLEIRSLTDLRWRITQAAAEHRPLQLEVTDERGNHRRQLTLALDRLEGHDLDAATWRQIGLPGPWTDPVMGTLVAGGPAEQAGLRQGDRVLRVDEVSVADAAALRERIRQGAGQAMRWTIDRSGVVMQLEVQPRRVEEGGQTFGRVDAYIGEPPQMLTVRLGLVDGAVRGVRQVLETAQLSLKMLGRMLIGEASVKNLSGPLTIADYAGQTARVGLTEFLIFLANVSVGLGVLNLLPLPILDGGHLIYYLFEGLTGRPVTDVWLRRLQRGGAVVLLLMMSIALSNDVARLLGLH
ncbi:RIP metalloprotease RseP [Ideonella sp. 4Y11]|uniref:Zinc metalloprotease n=1 Tax=Ideonella aquatica TaxID=2824119 RepID=A0A940YND3_9BURK|nr:RIP metalloprotease RseP [Ideonella aquatica]MBQ0959536.1 RIP metalloprotease RseP [Ideonella aquatica]